MAESEPKSEIQEESLKGSSISATLNGHSSIPKEEVKKMNHTENLENGEPECKSPQVNGDISDKSSLDNCELSKSDIDSCELPKSDSVCITKDSNKELNESDNISQNGKVISCTDIDSKTIASDNNDSVDKIVTNSEIKISNKSSSSSNTEKVEKGERSNDTSTMKSEEKSDIVQSVDKVIETKSDNQTNDELEEEKSLDKSNNDSKKPEDDKSKTVSEKGEKESKEVIEEAGEKKEAEKSEDLDDKAKKSETSTAEEGKTSTAEEGKTSTAEEGKTPTAEESKTSTAEEGKTPTVEEGKTPTAEDGKTPTAEEGKPAPSKEKKTPKKKKEINVEIVKRVTRSSSGITKPVKYVDPDPRDIIDDDDDIRITKEVKKNEESDIEMIEESDPLAISESDVKKAKETHKGTTFQERFKSIKQREPLHKGGSGKDNSNVIIIDTNTLIKGQGGMSTHHSNAQSKITSNVSAQTTVSTNATANIQTAIQTITGGNPAMQGLQSAYLNAIQQVLVAQGGTSVSNPHYIATLQQYYNTLGALQDDAYVIEAPSFIVPYVMEGKPVESIRDYLDRIKREYEEEEGKRKKEEEKKKKEEEEERKKKEEEDLEKKKEEEDLEKKKKDEEEKEKSEKSEEKEEPEKEKEDKEEKMEVDESESKEEKEESSNKDDEKDKKGEEEKMEVDSEVIEEKKESDEAEIKEVEKETKEEEKKEESKENASSENKENKKEEKPKAKEEEIIELDKEDKEDFSHLGRWEGYYRSALGKFFLELGLNHTQEFIQADLLKMQKRRVEKLKTNPTKQDLIAIKSLERQLNVSKEKNKPFFLQMKTCKFCSYKTESDLVMERHLESPHMVNYTYKCNFCDFETRGPQVILFHTEAEHNVRGRLERAPAFFQCPLCPFEDNNKSKMTRHSFSCAKKFKADKNCDLTDWEPPAKIPKIHRGRPNVSAFGKAFDGLKMQNILPKNLGGLNINLQNAISSSLLNSAANVSANSIAGRGRGRPVGSYKNITQNIGNRSGSLVYQNRSPGLLQPIQGVTSAQQLSIANQVLQSVTQGGSNRVPRILPAASAGSLLPGLAASSSITIQSVQNKSGNTKAPQQPSISITPLPRGGSQSSGNKSGNTTVPSAGNSQRPAFVICEICDGYIKDLEQLRNHMNLIHKVKIHPKMIYNRPPLNCQKCQHRFFTDQGLERHLLGTHGLVTSSMQEAANKGKDAGRCPICGKVFQWKLLNHVSRDHKMTLKPAHLSYKCTVCTATFNMYRLFENHVYSAHSVVNKNKSNESGGNSTTSSSSAPAKKPVTGTETPLKINDEITIIPQPAAKSPKTESKTSPKKDSPSVSKEITITKVGSRSSSRRSGSSSNSNNSGSGSSSGGGGGVEVISLDDSPQKRQAEEPPKKRTRETATSKRARTSS